MRTVREEHARKNKMQQEQWLHPTGKGINAKLLISARELGEILGVNRSTIWTWHSSGRIPLPIKIGGTTRWRLNEIEQWLEAGAPPRKKWLLLRGEQSSLENNEK